MSHTKKFKEFVGKLVERRLQEMFEDVIIYDNGGETADRYSVVIGEDVYNMSHNPLMPNGVNIYAGRVGQDIELPDGDEWGGRIDISEVPEQVQKAIHRLKQSNEAKSSINESRFYYIETWHDGGKMQQLGSDGTTVLRKKPSRQDIEAHHSKIKSLQGIKPHLKGNLEYKVVDDSGKVLDVVDMNQAANETKTYKKKFEELVESVIDQKLNINEEDYDIGGHPIEIPLGDFVSFRNNQVVIIAKDQAFKDITSGLKQMGISYDIGFPF